MDVRSNKFTRFERIKSRSVAERLFMPSGRGVMQSNDGAVPSPRSALVYPLRAVWTGRDVRLGDAPFRVLVSVPKRRLRHAVDRVKMRRRIREAFRLAKGRYMVPGNELSPFTFDVAFVYVADALLPYDTVAGAVEKLLRKISASALGNK